jgi:FkbM family methyltransferase
MSFHTRTAAINHQPPEHPMFELNFHKTLHRPGTIIDIGAHDGALTVPLSHLASTNLIAFEPLPTAFARLQAAITAAHGTIPTHVTLHNEALGAIDTMLTLEVPVVAGIPQEQWASLVKDYTTMQRTDPGIEHVQRFTVQVRPLDSLHLTDVTAIKLDAEGAEADILQGAQATIQSCRPILSIEIEERHRPGSTKAVPHLLSSLGYHGFYEFYGDWCPIEGFDPQKLQRASPSPAVFEASHPYIFCFYFVPPERLSELATLARLP